MDKNRFRQETSQPQKPTKAKLAGKKMTIYDVVLRHISILSSASQIIWLEAKCSSDVFMYVEIRLIW